MVKFNNSEGKENSNNFQRAKADHLQRNENQIDIRLLKTGFERVME